MQTSTMMRLGVIVAFATLAAGCASSCGANPSNLAALKRGMSYDETVQVMGCAGTQTSKATVASGDFATVEWDGPRPRLANRTQIDFINGQLLSYTIDGRFGF